MKVASYEYIELRHHNYKLAIDHDLAMLYVGQLASIEMISI